MTNPFRGRAMGARAQAQQFPQRRALSRKNGGEVPGMFLGGLFGGTPGSSTTTSNTRSDSGVSDPDYNALKGGILSQGLNLAFKPYEAYTGQGVVGTTADQQTAYGNVRANQGNYQPFLDQAAGSVGRIGNLDPAAAGLPYVGEAAGMQTGQQASSPFVSQASQTFPGQVDQYMSPYTDQVVNRIADLGNRNLMENVLPGVNDTFTGGDAAQFGRERHADITGRAIRDNQESIMGQQAQALESGYNTAGNLFNQDANRAAGLAGTTAGIAQGDIAQRAGLGTTAANITNQGITGGAQAAGAATGLGLAQQGAGLTDANALTASGSQQQQQAQNEETWKYNQFIEKRNDPYAKAQFGQGISQGWQLPTTSSSQSNSTQTQTAPQGSPFGQILGAGLGIASMFGSGGPLAGMGSLGSLFGGGGAAAGSGMLFAQGGMVPSIAAMRKSFAPPQGQGAMPTGMPGMPPMPTLAPQLPQGQPNGQPASPFADGGRVTKKSPPRPTLEQQLDAFGKRINATAPTWRGHESPNPFERDPNPDRWYADGGEVPAGYDPQAILPFSQKRNDSLEDAVNYGDSISPNYIQALRKYGVSGEDLTYKLIRQLLESR